MSNYHITQEQATDLFKPFVLPIKEVVAQSKDDFYFVTDEQLKAFANAVLDKVLGEPVAEVESINKLSREPQARFFANGREYALYRPKVGDKLYAPRELP